MRYLLHLRGDGKEPGYSAVAHDYIPNEAAGEVVVEDVPPGYVWDEASQVLRPKTDAERLEEAKTAKIAELGQAAKDELAPLFTDGFGEEEVMFLQAAALSGAQSDPRLAEVARVGEKAMGKKAEVQSAATIEEVEAVQWTP